MGLSRNTITCTSHPPRVHNSGAIRPYIPCALKILPRPPPTQGSPCAAKPKHQNYKCLHAKIGGSALVTYRMVVAGFSLQDKLERVRFFTECLSSPSPMQTYGCREGACLEELHISPEAMPFGRDSEVCDH